MKKRMLSFLLVVCMLVSLLPVGMLSASAATTDPTLSYKFKAAAKASGKTIFQYSGDLAWAAVGSDPIYCSGVTGGQFYYAAFDGVPLFYLNTKADQKSAMLFQIVVDEAGVYTPEVIFDSINQNRNTTAHFYITGTDILDWTVAETKTHVIDIPDVDSATAKAGNVVTSENEIAMAEGTYFLWYVKDAPNGTATHGYAPLDTLNLYKVRDIEADSVTISGATHMLDIGGSVTLTATVEPPYAGTYHGVTWASSNPSVATVDGGVVTATGNGVATITATCNGVSATYDVFVGVERTYNYDINGYVASLPAGTGYPAALRSVTMADTANFGSWEYYKTSLSSSFPGYSAGRVFFQGDNGNAWYAIRVNITEPGYYHTRFIYDQWSSHASSKVCIAPESVAIDTIRADHEVITVPKTTGNTLGVSVESDELVALGKGSHVIVFERTSPYGVNGNGERYMTMDAVELYKVKDIEVTSVSISGAVDNQLLAVGETCNISATYEPAIAGAEISWSVEGNAVSLKNGVVTALKEGTATITATAGGKSDSITFTVGALKGSYRIQDFVEANKDKTGADLDLASSMDSEYKWVYFDKQVNLGRLTASGKAFINNNGGSKWYAIMFKVEEGGVYRANMVYDTTTSSCDGEVFIVPRSLVQPVIGQVPNHSLALTDEYKVIDIPWSQSELDDLNAPSNKNITLHEGEYVAYFLGNGSYYKGHYEKDGVKYDYINPETGEYGLGNYDRYLLLDELQLYKVGEVNVESIELSADTNILRNDVPVTVKATLSPESAGYREKDIVWTSSDNSIATVSGGVVTGLKTGNVTITATIDGKSDSVDFKVVEYAHTYDIQGFAQEFAKTVPEDTALHVNAKFACNEAKKDGVVLHNYYNEPITAEETALFGGWAYHTRRGNINYSNGDTFMGGYGVLGCYGISFTISEAGIYHADLVYDQWGGAADGAIFIAPKNIGYEEVVTNDKYRVVYVPNDSGSADDVVAEGEKAFILGEGDYVAWFVPYASRTAVNDASGKAHYFNKPGAIEEGDLDVKPTFNAETGEFDLNGWVEGDVDRYFVVDELKLYKAGNVSDILSTVNGAQLRATGGGLRFISQISRAYLAEDNNADANLIVEYGTVMVPTNALTVAGGTQYTVDDIKVGAKLNGFSVAKIEAKNIYEQTTALNKFTGVLINIQPQFYTREITARAYALLADGTYIYGNEAERSLYDVAEKIHTAPQEGEKESAKKKAASIYHSVNKVDADTCTICNPPANAEN